MRTSPGGVRAVRRIPGEVRHEAADVAGGLVAYQVVDPAYEQGRRVCDVQRWIREGVGRRAPGCGEGGRRAGQDRGGGDHPRFSQDDGTAGGLVHGGSSHLTSALSNGCHDFRPAPYGGVNM